MPAYPTTESEQRVQANDLLALARGVFERCGIGNEDARLLADTLVTADLRGVHSHGVLRVPEYVKKLTAGVGRIYAPGELEDVTAEAYRRQGIPLNPETLAGVRRAALEVGVAVPSWLGE